MRLFAAVPISSPAREAVASLITDLRAGDWPVRWVRDEGVHLTLKFFGEVAASRLEVLAEAVRAAGEGTGPMALRLGELGAFPSRHRPRVLWLGVEAPPSLELLQDRLERRFEALGFAPEGQVFQPHVTLGRVREGHRLAAERLDTIAGRIEPLPFVADQLVIYESLPGPGGSRFEPRFTHTLSF